MKIKWIFSVILTILIASQTELALALPNHYFSDYLKSFPTSTKFTSQNPGQNGVTDHLMNYFYRNSGGLMSGISYGSRVYAGRVFGDRYYGDHGYGDLGYGDFPRDSWIEIPVGPRWSNFQTSITNRPLY